MNITAEEYTIFMLYSNFQFLFFYLILVLDICMCIEKY